MTQEWSVTMETSADTTTSSAVQDDTATVQTSTQQDDRGAGCEQAALAEAGKGAEPEKPKCLDLVFAMDCTGSMGSYIHQAQQVSPTGS